MGIKDIASLLLFIAIMFTSLFGLITVGDMYMCNGYETNTGVSTKYDGLRCYVTVDGKTMAYEEYKNSKVGHKVTVD